MGIERTTDFIIYLCDSLQNELVAGIPRLVRDDLDFTCPTLDKENLSRTLSMCRREVSGFLRPVFRKHERFASRFPTVGGNLGSMFMLSAPAEDIQRGETEARLAGQTYKDPAEALLALMMNNVHNFGHQEIARLAETEGRKQIPPMLAKLLAGAQSPEEVETPSQPEPAQSAGNGPADLISKPLFVKLSVDAIETVCTILRDSMLEQVRKNASELEVTQKEQR